MNSMPGLAWTAFAATVCLYAAGTVLGAVAHPVTGIPPFELPDAMWPIPWLGFGAVGAVVAHRHPRNPVGWLFIGTAALMVVNYFCDSYATAVLSRSLQGPGADLAAWLALWTWIPAIGLFTAFFVVFPTGAPPSPRWRWLLWATGAVHLMVIAAATLIPVRDGLNLLRAVTPADADRGEVLSVVANVMTPPLVVLAIASLVVRFRRSRRHERQQLKWFSLAAATYALVLIGMFAVGGEDPMGVPAIATAHGVGTLALPLSAGVAILRYRLYDVDRVISRSVAWLLITLVVGGVYMGAVSLLMATVVPVTGGSSAAVAAATLAAAGIFGPARRRIQRAVDRRFNRARYNAATSVEMFSSQLRDHVEPERLGAELLSVVRATLQPVGTTLWLRDLPPVSPSRDR